MSTRIYCDQCGSETSERTALRFHMKGHAASRVSMNHIGEVRLDLCPKCAERLNGMLVGELRIQRDRRDALAPYKLEYTPLNPKGQA